MNYAELLHPGLTRYHHVSYLVPLCAALSPMLFARMPLGSMASHHKALVFGAIAFGACLGLMMATGEPQAYPKSILLGLLVAEFTVFGASTKVPSVVNILLFSFIYMYAISKIKVAGGGGYPEAAMTAMTPTPTI